MKKELARYHRQILLPDFDEAAQEKLCGSTALLLGCGALGSVAADMLARAGVGHLVIVDRDFLELTNLQRQVLFDERDVADGIPKAEAARRRLAAVNSNVRVTAIVDDINRDTIDKFARGADVLVDGLDNFETRYLANDFAVRNGVPYVYGAAVGTTGMAFPVLPHTHDRSADWETAREGNLATPCLRCLFDEPPAPGTSPTCDTIGVLNAAVALVGNIQVAETLKILTGNYARVRRRLLNLDLWTNEIHQLGVESAREKGDCPTCCLRRFDFLEGGAGSTVETLCGRNAIQLRHGQGTAAVNLSTVAERLRAHGDVRINEFLLRVEIEDGDLRYEISLFADGRAIIKGTDDPAQAKAIHARYVGA